jgi:8-oxo-dGTP diphosphatase
MLTPPDAVRELVASIVPADELERAHQRDMVEWLKATPDIYRRQKPATPPMHLVSYAVLIDPHDMAMFLVDHRRAGLSLPPGGHVEPGEDPADTVRREVMEELSIKADFSIMGALPAFVTVTRTRGVTGGHTDVSLWYVISGSQRSPIRLDPREFAGGRWWTWADLESADPAPFRSALRPLHRQGPLTASRYPNANSPPCSARPPADGPATAWPRPASLLSSQPQSIDPSPQQR